MIILSAKLSVDGPGQLLSLCSSVDADCFDVERRKSLWRTIDYALLSSFVADKLVHQLVQA